MLPRITVVTPSFNQARFIELTINSVLEQNYPDIEYIIMDGGSSDGSVDIIRKYDDKIAYWTSAPDGGQTDALIRGFSISTGKIQCWLCSDDILAPGALLEVGEYFARHGDVDVVYGDSYWIDADGRPLRPKKEHGFSRFIWLNHENYLPQPSTFWRSSLYEKVGGLNRQFDLAMDADLWIRFSEAGKIRHVRRTWSQMRFYPEQKNRRLRAQSDKEDQLIRDRYLSPRSQLEQMYMRGTARIARVIWKAITGCYWGRAPEIHEQRP